MLRIVLIAALVYSASAGLIAGPAVVSAPVSYAAGPALGAPLLGSVTYNAPEVNVVKQPITIDQPVIQYRAVPQVIQPHVVVHHQPAVVATHHVVAQPTLTLAHHEKVVVA